MATFAQVRAAIDAMGYTVEACAVERIARNMDYGDDFTAAELVETIDKMERAGSLTVDLFSSPPAISIC